MKICQIHLITTRFVPCHLRCDLYRPEQTLWIAKLRTVGFRGYNMCEGGRGAVGYAHRPDSIAKMQKACVGRRPSKACLDRSKEVRAGGVSDDAKDRMSAAQRARRAATPITDEFRAKMKVISARVHHSPQSAECVARRVAATRITRALRKAATPEKLCSTCSKPVAGGAFGLCKKHYDVEWRRKRKLTWPST